jgi:hypothetical protein
MIRKFAAVPWCHRVWCYKAEIRFVLAMTFFGTILTGTATVHAQQTSTQPSSSQETPAQQPAAQQPSPQSSSQEASPEETGRRVKPKNYKDWTFNVGGGASLTSGTTQTFVRGGGGVAAAGVAHNTNQYFGFRADFQFDNLPLRQSALDSAQAPTASSRVYSIMLDPIINVPASKNWGGYIVFGPAFFHRSGRLQSSAALPGSSCDAFFIWWGNCLASGLPLSGDFLKANQNEFGFNFGGGITRQIRGDIEFYAEIRYMHGTHNSVTTDLRPITIGVRW